MSAASNVKEAAEVEVAADKLWSEVGSFGSMAAWHPHLSGMTVERRSAALLRTASFKTGRQQVERLDAVDDARRVYRYSVEHTSLPVSDYTGEFRIETLAERKSRIVWEVHFRLAGEHDERTVGAIRYFLHEGVTGIQSKYSPYVEREAAGVESQIADADKTARAGTVNEPVRNTPPAGAWNETTSD